MERLTFGGNFCDISQCRELPCPYNGSCTQKKVWERLKAYEDTGLSPQACAEAREIEETLSSCDYSISRMVDLMKADRDGRVLILPCKVGDTVYRLQYIEQTPGRFTVGIVPIKFALIWLEAFGETVFLSHEEAEKALQKMEGKKDG
jgi:hypothetical protein|uniref:Uncharacterized protein n=2 Tax=unclassified Caudoviricetes TaxID=2788787 RepID=A0A8S5VCB6_9CAUD|nr:MAG TPA: hypothetical protein [Siphoviridae sp. ctHDv29]DAG04251.1 MAG TPA: hypothetical protein [Siphoviridae sp. ctKsH2]